jgi:hypothetical protein
LVFTAVVDPLVFDLFFIDVAVDALAEDDVVVAHLVRVLVV